MNDPQALEINEPTAKTEAKALVRLAAPIIGALVLTSLMGVIDTVMAGRVSPSDLAAVAIGAAIWHMLLLTMTGILMALTPQIAKLFGQKNTDSISVWYQLGIRFTLVIALIFLIIGWLASQVIFSLDTTEEITNLSFTYLISILCGLPAVALFSAQRSLSEGHGISKHVLIITVLGVLINIPLNYVFIYGAFGLPAMGGAGCGVASAIIFWTMTLAMHKLQTSDRKLTHAFKALTETRTSEPLPDGAVYKQLLKVGIPIGLAILAESSVFAYIPLVVAHLGPEQVSAHQIALNVASIMFMVPLGLSQAITVRTGFQLGRKSSRLALITSRTGILLAFFFGLCSMSLIMLNANFIATLYTSDITVIELSVTILILAALFQLSDTLQISTAGALRGYQLTTVPMVITITAFWIISMPAGYILGLESTARNWLTHEAIGAQFFAQWLPPAMGVEGFWYGLIIGLSINALLLISYMILKQRRLSDKTRAETTVT